MYHNSTQRKFWTFKDETEVLKARSDANENYRRRYLEKNPNGKNYKTDILFSFSFEIQCAYVLQSSVLQRFNTCGPAEIGEIFRGSASARNENFRILFIKYNVMKSQLKKYQQQIY